MIHSFFHSTFAEDHNKRCYYITYTVLFLLASFLCFSWFIFSGKSLIWNYDGWKQHYKAIVYYSQYLRSITGSLFRDHQLIIPEWDFCIGEGSDILSTLNYYVMGDPIALLSVFVPTRFMPVFFSGSNVFRLYLAGLSFSALCFGTGQKNRYGIMAGSLAYCFCFWGLFTAVRHPFFINPMIYFPLIILGMEKILRRERPYLFIVSVAVSAASNFYFFYIIVILAAVYALIRLGFLYGKHLMRGFLMLVRITLTAAVGVCMSGVIFLPVLMFFVKDNRMSSSPPFRLLYPLFYYSRLPSVFVTAEDNNFWLILGFVPLVVLAVFFLFMKKKSDTFLKVLTVACLAITLFPIGGRILNGMSYMANRWSWAFALLCVYILVKKWDDLLALSDRQWAILTVFSVIFYVVCLFFDMSRTIASFAAIPMFFITLDILRTDFMKGGRPVLRQVLLLGMVIAGVANTSFWWCSPDTENYVSETMDADSIWDEWQSNEASVIMSMTNGDYTRISGRDLTENANIFSGVSSTQYYWTLSNPYVVDYRTSLAMKDTLTFQYYNYDDRTTPTVLSSVGYYSVKEDNSKGIPYGFTYLDTQNADPTQNARLQELAEELGTDELTPEQTAKIEEASSNNYSIFQNENTLPAAYCYDAWFSGEEWDAFDPVQRQEAQLEAACTDKAPEGISRAQLEMPEYTVPFEIECQGAEITQGDNSFITTANNTQIMLTLPVETPNAETYVSFSGLEFTPTRRYALYFGDETVDPLSLYNKTNWDMLTSDQQYSVRQEKVFTDAMKETYIDAVITLRSSSGIQKAINYTRPDSTHSSGLHDFIVNLGYVEEPVTKISITFSNRGIYSFDSLKVYSIPMEGFEEKVAKLRENTLQNMEFGVNTMTGDISLTQNKLLCFATPFSDGWKADIDGQETDVYCLNKRYPGIVVPAGDHTIRFSYHTPYKDEGGRLSVIGFAAFLLVILITEITRLIVRFISRARAHR